GHDTATNQVLTPNAPDSSPRVTPRSSVTGLRNTPKVKIRIAPAPTKRPQAQANTIHQRLAKIPVMTPSPLRHSDRLLVHNVSFPAPPHKAPPRRPEAKTGQTGLKGSTPRIVTEQAPPRQRASEPRIDIDIATTRPGTPGGIFMRQFWHAVCRSRDLPVG